MSSEISQGHDFQLYFNDNLKLFLFKKTEKISLAIYLVTDHLSDKESLKTRIRDLANEIIKDIVYLNNGQYGNNSIQKIKDDFIQINTLLNLASFSGLISQQNILILSEEINRLLRDVQNQKDNMHSVQELKKSFFVVESRIRHSEPENIHKGQKEYKGHIENSETVKNVVLKSSESLNKDRSQEIMKIIKDNGKVSIKDISFRVKDCSEKTIQRELSKLVSLNLIKKEGERRWSTYSIK